MESLEEFLLDNDFEKFQIQESFAIYNYYIKKDVEVRYIISSNFKNAPKHYFSNITEEYNNQNKRIIWIKDYEWNNERKRNVLKSYIKSAIGVVDNRIFARKCEIKEISNKEAKPFLEKNCMYGFRAANKTYGLFYNNELVMLESFGSCYYGRNKAIELIRSSSKLNTQIVGGASKLLKHFLKENPYLIINGKQIEVEDVIFYVDADHNNGNSMEKLGYKFVNYEKDGFHNYAIKDCPELGLKAGFALNRQPKKHKEIKKAIKEEKIIKIETAGTIVYKINRLDFLTKFCNNHVDTGLMKNKIEEKILKRWDLSLEDDYDKIFETVNNKKQYKKYLFKCNKCGYEWRQGVRFDRNLSCPHCYPFAHGSSAGELELYNYFLTTGLKIEHNNRTILKGKEIDIYLPDLKIGIEYDGDWWHTETKNKEKDLLAEAAGIKLIRINDEEFTKNKKYVLDNLEKELNIKFGDVKEIKTLTQKAKRIICLQNLKIYESYKEAANDLGLKTPSNILNVCNGNLKHYKNYTFEYYNEEKKYKQIEKKNNNYATKKIMCIETNEVFNSLSEAVKKYKTKTISECANGKQKTAAGKHWKWI